MLRCMNNKTDLHMKYLIYISFLLPILTFATPVQSTLEEKVFEAQKDVEAIDTRLQALDAKVELYNNYLLNEYDGLSSEINRDFSWLAIVVAVFSLLVGVVVPLIINGEYRRYYIREMNRNQKDFDKRLEDEDVKLKQFESDFAFFKKGYEIRILMEKAADTEDLSSRIDYYSQVISLDSEYVSALQRRAVAYRTINKYKEAIADFKAVIKLQPDTIAAYSGLGYTYHLAGNYPYAIKQYDKALELNPMNPNVLYRKSMTLTETEDFKNALTCVEKAIETKSDVVAYHIRRRRIMKKISVTEYAAEIKKENEIIEKLQEGTKN